MLLLYKTLYVVIKYCLKYPKKVYHQNKGDCRIKLKHETCLPATSSFWISA